MLLRAATPAKDICKTRPKATDVAAPKTKTSRGTRSRRCIVVAHCAGRRSAKPNPRRPPTPLKWPSGKHVFTRHNEPTREPALLPAIEIERKAEPVKGMTYVANKQPYPIYPLR